MSWDRDHGRKENCFYLSAESCTFSMHEASHVFSGRWTWHIPQLHLRGELAEVGERFGVLQRHAGHQWSLQASRTLEEHVRIFLMMVHFCLSYALEQG